MCQFSKRIIVVDNRTQSPASINPDCRNLGCPECLPRRKEIWRANISDCLNFSHDSGRDIYLSLVTESEWDSASTNARRQSIKDETVFQFFRLMTPDGYRIWSTVPIGAGQRVPIANAQSELTAAIAGFDPAKVAHRVVTDKRNGLTRTVPDGRVFSTSKGWALHEFADVLPPRFTKIDRAIHESGLRGAAVKLGYKLAEWKAYGVRMLKVVLCDVADDVREAFMELAEKMSSWRAPDFYSSTQKANYKCADSSLGGTADDDDFRVLPRGCLLC